MGWSSVTNCCWIYVVTSVIKPGPAWRVDPGPGRPGAWTGLGSKKDQCKEKTSQTRYDPARPGWPGRTQVRPGLYILTHFGKIGKAKGKLNFYPKFLSLQFKVRTIKLYSSAGIFYWLLCWISLFFSLNILAPPFTGSCHHLVESCSL